MSLSEKARDYADAHAAFNVANQYSSDEFRPRGAKLRQTREAFLIFCADALLDSDKGDEVKDTINSTLVSTNVFDENEITRAFQDISVRVAQHARERAANVLMDRLGEVGLE